MAFCNQHRSNIACFLLSGTCRNISISKYFSERPPIYTHMRIMHTTHGSILLRSNRLEWFPACSLDRPTRASSQVRSASRKIRENMQAAKLQCFSHNMNRRGDGMCVQNFAQRKTSETFGYTKNFQLEFS